MARKRATHILENDSAKASNKRHHLGKAPDKRRHVGDKRKDMQADPAQSPSAKTSTKRRHAGDKCQEMQTNSLQNGPRPPEADTMQETPVKCKEIKA